MNTATAGLTKASGGAARTTEVQAASTTTTNTQADKERPTNVNSKRSRPRGDHDQVAGRGAAAGGAKLKLVAGEELTALTRDEMASVCSKLEDFARSNPDRVGSKEDGP